mmetsp:Transcript_7265/g.14136  ORF Transcript_7265/g.14136 Transcript_7265/m.14136 type:complete len:297 (+) Transcript_7265:422-1312(+)
MIPHLAGPVQRHGRAVPSARVEPEPARVLPQHAVGARIGRDRPPHRRERALARVPPGRAVEVVGVGDAPLLGPLPGGHEAVLAAEAGHGDLIRPRPSLAIVAPQPVGEAATAHPAALKLVHGRPPVVGRPRVAIAIIVIVIVILLAVVGVGVVVVLVLVFDLGRRRALGFRARAVAVVAVLVGVVWTIGEGDGEARARRDSVARGVVRVVSSTAGLETLDACWVLAFARADAAELVAAFDPLVQADGAAKHGERTAAQALGRVLVRPDGRHVHAAADQARVAQAVAPAEVVRGDLW